MSIPSAELLAHWEGEVTDPRMVPGQGLCVLRRFIYTTGLLTHVQIDETGCNFRLRYCYPDRRDAVEAIRTWDGQGDPPGQWVKEKTSGRPGPAASAEAHARYERLRLRWEG